MAATLRSRVVVIAILLCASGLFVFELPIRELMHQRSAINTTSSELSALTEENQNLQSTISSLGHNSVISAIAHADYGLIFSGQQSYVVLPGSGDVAGSANTLNNRTIPSADLVPTDAASLSGASSNNSSSTSNASSPKGPTSGIVSKTLSRLEFWRWAF